MKKTALTMLVLMIFTVLSFNPVSYAFNDIKGSKGEHHIKKLKDRGVIKGSNKGKFNPKNNLSYAEAVVMLDEAFEFSLAHIKFAKEPKLSDIYTKVKDEQWYSKAFLEGYYNGVVFDKNVKPHDSISREEFAALLIQQLDKKVEYSIIEIFIQYKDQGEVNKNYSDEIQKLLILKFEELDKNNKFNPKKAVLREEASVWLENVLNFIDEQLALEQQQPAFVLSDIVVKRDAITNEADKVTITATVPHPGYGATISSISFEGNIAYITLNQVNPDPDKMYPQVISTVTLTTFLAKQYKIEVVTP